MCLMFKRAAMPLMGESMPIHRLVENSAFQPEEIAVMISAYERAARELTLADGESRESNERIATMIIELAQTGERDGSIIAEKTIARLHR